MGPPLYFSHPACLEHETGEHPERPARIQAIETELERRGWLGYERREAPAAPLEAVTAVHAEAYVEAVRASSASRRSLDEETVLSPGSYPAALHAAGGACAMVDALVAGEARAGFCGTRPPGHHARSDTTSGFCLFNNAAVAAQHALDALGARRVFIFDWDVHHGDGTNDIFRTSDAVLFASIHRDDPPPTGARRGGGGSGRRRARGRLRAGRSRRLGGGHARALAGDEPPEMVAPDYLTARAASYIGHHWTL